MKDKIIFISSSMMPLENFLLEQIKSLSYEYDIQASLFTHWEALRTRDRRGEKRDDV